LFLFLLVLPLMSAVELEINGEYKNGETLNAKISGNFFQPVLKDNIYFYRDSVRVPFEFDLLIIKGDYYISTPTLGKTSGNYSIVIENSEYSVLGGGTSDDDLFLNFTILEEFADFSTKPGVLITNDSFSLEIRNLQDKEITIQIDKGLTEEETTSGGFFTFFSKGENKTSSGQEITLKSGETESITLKFENVFNSTLRTVKLSTENFTQEVLVYVLGSDEETGEEANILKFEISYFNISMATNSNAARILNLMNKDELDFDNVTFIISDSLKNYVILDKYFIEDFESNETERIVLNITSNETVEFVEGTIRALTSNNVSAYVGIQINIIEDYIPDEEGEKNLSITQTCSELGGEICNQGYKCSGKKENSKDGKCCLEECVEKKKSSFGKIIAWVVIILLVVGYAWFYFKRFRKTKRKVNLLKAAGEKEDEFGEIDDEEDDSSKLESFKR